MKIALVTDSNIGITEEKAKELGLYYVHYPFRINGIEYVKSENYINTVELVKNTKQAMTTSQAPLGDVILTWDEALKTHDHILHLPMSSGLSSMASVVKSLTEQEEYAGKVTVIDMKEVIGLHAYEVQVARHLINNNYPLAEIVTILENRISSAWGVLVVQDIANLKRGGRINTATALYAGVMGIKPLIEVKDGHLDKLDRARTVRKAIDLASQYFFKLFNPKKHYAIIHSTHEVELSNQMKNIVLNKYEDAEVFFYNITEVIMCHTGAGSVAFSFVEKFPGVEFEEWACSIKEPVLL